MSERSPARTPLVDDLLPDRAPPPEPPPAPPPSRGMPGWLKALLVLLVLAAVVVVLRLALRPLWGQEVVVVGTPVGPAPPAGLVGVFVEPVDGRAPVLEELDAATGSIDLEVYLLSDEDVIAALERAHARGVHVRVLLEQHPFGGSGNTPEVFARLQAAGIDARWSNPAFNFSHIKMFVVDRRTAVIMNQNLSATSFTKNREFGAVSTRPADVATALAVFEADWTRGAEPDPAPLVVSPTNAREQLVGLIDGATRTLDVYAEVMRDPEIMDALKRAAGRGVRVRLVMSGREGDDNAKERTALAAAGVQVHLVNRVYIHAKMLLADGERAYIGSQNFTATSLDQNRELGLVLDDPVALARLARNFDNDFAAGKPEGVT